MNQTVPFEPHRFQSAAAHYRAGRPPYPPSLIRRVAQATGLDGDGRVLDLGCGPGPLAIGFAYFAREVLAVDPEPHMLEAAAAAAQGLAPNLRFRLGSSKDLDPSFGRFHLVVMGRSFHWMDRPATLATLDTLIEPRGAVVLFGTDYPDVPANAWRTEWRALLGRYNENDAWHQRRHDPAWPSHETVLLDSTFCRLELVAMIERRTRTVDSLLEYALSRSSTSRARIGARADAMLAEARAYLAGVAQSGRIDEVVRSTATIARRAA